jgi:hypothetical protein
MPARLPFLKRLGVMTLALLAVTALCRHQGVNADLPVVHGVTAAVFPSLPRLAWAAEVEPMAVAAVIETPAPADGLLAAGLALAAVAFAARLARTWVREHDARRSPAS